MSFRPFSGAVADPRSNLDSQQGALAALLREQVAAGWTPQVAGHCMRPSIQHGARLRFQPCRMPLPGDVVAVLAEDKRVLVHRFLGFYWRQGVVLATGSDAAAELDAPARATRLLGRLVEVDGQPYRVSVTARWRAVERFVRRGAQVSIRRFPRWHRSRVGSAP